MQSLHLHLHDDLTSRISERAAENGFESPEAYIEALLKADAGEQVAVDTELEDLLIRRIQSGPGIPVTPAFIEQFKQEVAQRRNSRRTGS